MTNFLRTLGGLLLLLILTACGGGGGSPGAVSGGSAPAAGAATTMLLELRDKDNLPTVSVGVTGATTLRATLRPIAGLSVANRLVSFTADSTKLSFPQGSTALTDASGVARVLVTPASLLASGAGTIDASAVVGSNTLTGRMDYQLSVANLTLANLNLGGASLAAFGNRAVTVQVNANGAPATAPVQVSFSASCGTIEPATAVTNVSGLATATYKADAPQGGCGGSNVSISASTSGTAPLSGNLTITAAPATNLQFVSADPTLIYLSGSGGRTQSTVKFKVVNATGGALQGVDVRLSLINAATDVSLDTVGSSAPVVKTTDFSGDVSVAVFSGAVPTPLQVRAVLVSNAGVETTSSVLTVASGRAAQARASLSRDVFALEGWNIDGPMSKHTFSIADRQGNPVPDGTVVNFVTEGGVMVPPTCVTAGGTSQCTVSLRAQNPRPAGGRVTVMAYVQGEEDFVDANFNNRYDLGETFTDLGNAFRDDDESGDYSLGEFSVPRAGSTTCAGGDFGRPNTCDGVWGPVEVRSTAVVIFATGRVNMELDSRTAGALRVIVADLNGNSPPTGSTITATYAGTGGCKVEGPFPKIVGNTLTPVAVDVGLSGCSATDTIRITVTSPSGVGTIGSF